MIDQSATTGEERTTGALYDLLELSKALSSEVDLDSLLNVIVAKTSAVVGAERTSIFVYDAETQRLWTRVAEGLESNRIELPLGSGIAGSVAATMKIENITDPYRDPRFNPDVDRETGYRTRSILCAPVVDTQGQLLGVLEVINKRSDHGFDTADETMMIVLASHVAVALERARMTEMYVTNRSFEQALRVAQEIQMRMLPAMDPIIPQNLPIEISAYIRPAKMVGGDFYDYSWEAGGRIYLCIGDVAGKGVGAALVMVMAKTLLRSAIPVHGDPAALMAAVNNHLHEETDPSMFVTAFCADFDRETGELRFCSAGHNPPLVITQSGAMRTLTGGAGPPLGVVRNLKYALQSTTIEKGDSLFLYTDGVSEAMSPAGDLFSLDLVRNVLADCAGRSASEIRARMIEAVDRFSGGAPQSDDITLMCMRYL